MLPACFSSLASYVLVQFGEIESIALIIQSAWSSYQGKMAHMDAARSLSGTSLDIMCIQLCEKCLCFYGANR